MGRPSRSAAKVDIIARDSNGDAFLFIEVKAPDTYENERDKSIEGQLFKVARQESANHKVKYLVYYTADLSGNSLKDKCIVIDYEKFKKYDDWSNAGQDCSNNIPKPGGKAKKIFYKRGKNELQTEFDHQELNKLRTDLHNYLWGGGGTDDNEIFSSLVNIILAKIQDESDTKEGCNYQFQIFTDRSGEHESDLSLYNRINELYKKALKEKLHDKESESNVINKSKFQLKKLRYTVSKLEKYSFIDGKNSLDGKDILGDFFENIVRQGFKQDKGQLFSHTNIVKFILWGLQLDKLAIKTVNEEKRLPYMIDPSAGSGTFLIECMKFITENVKTRFKNELNKTREIEDNFNDWFMPDHRENQWAKEYIYGIDINFNLGTAIKVNMILHGDGSANIFVKDGLISFDNYDHKLKANKKGENYLDKQLNEQFDCIMTNPPFSGKLDNETDQNLKNEFIFGDKKNSENLFIERWYQLLKPNGRLGAVLPESDFDTTENKYIRLFIYKYFKIKAVVSLPQLAFEPYTSTKTSLIFAQKKTEDEIKKWDGIWSKYSEEWNKLKTNCKNLSDVYLNGKTKKILSSTKNLNPDEEKDILERMLKDCLEENDKNISPKELIERYQKELKELCEYDKDTVDVFGKVNTWWVFGEVAKELNYKIFMAEADNIGYKRRTNRTEKTMPNELYRVNDKNEVLVNDGIEKTVLDYLREIKWD